ncbi:MAG: heme-binding protein [Rhodospirillales bacterium]|nr:heme-binding protein [Rhodospirillales bacterium]
MLDIKRLSLADAQILIEGAKRKSVAIGVPMCVAVVDESGNLIAFERMDGAKVLSVGLSQDKAFAAAVSRRPTHEYNEMCKPGNLTFGIHTSSGGRFSTVGGGFPVVLDNTVVGGIGLSGGAAEQDMEVARAAIGHFQGR